MKQVVYADLLFLVNFSMDFLCFFVTARLLHKDVKRWRMLIASAMGGIYSVAVLFLPIGTFAAVMIDLLFCFFMCMCAFGIKNGGAFGYFISSSVYFGVSVGTGGLMTAMYSLLNRMELPLGEVEEKGDGISVWLFGLLAIISGVAASFGGDLFKTVSSDTVSKIKITYKGVDIETNGMIDTGNLITDPIGGKPIVVIDVNVAAKLLGDDCANAAAKGNLASDIWQKGEHKVRIVPINTAGGNSVLCAFVPDDITVEVRSDKRRATRSLSVEALFAPSYLNFDVKKKAFGCGALVPSSLIT